MALGFDLRQRCGAPDPPQRGAGLIEAAIATPLLIMFVLGIFEIGLASSNILGLNNGVRAGARTASAGANDAYTDYMVLRSVQGEISALKRADVKYIVVFKSSASAGGPTAGCRAGNPANGVCNVYTPSDFARPKAQFGCIPNQSPDRYWCPTNRNVRVSGTGTDYIGVWIRFDHSWVTKMFGSSRTFTEFDVVRIEPRIR